MKLFVMAGPSGPTLKIDVDPNDTVLDAKVKLERETQFKPEKQIMKFKGKVLNDDKATLASCGIGVDKTLRNQSVSVRDH